MSRVLLVTHSHFWRRQNGAATRINALVTALQASGNEVGLFFVGVTTPEDLVALDSMGVKQRICALDGITLTYRAFMTFRWNTLLCLPRYLLKLWYRYRKKSFPFAKFRLGSIEKCFDKYLTEYTPDVVLLEYIRFSFLLRKDDTKRLWILDTHDVMHRRYARFLSRNLVHWVAISREEEVSALQGADLVIAIQQEEAEVLRNMVGAEKVLIVPHGVLVEPVPEQVEKVISIGYLAADNIVNLDAISWFLENVWPSVRQRFPDVQFLVAGQICRRLAGCCVEGVYLLGRVENVQSFYSRVGVIVNPVHSGGGLKIKNVEALAAGVPLMTTKVGAEGFPESGELPFVVANTGKEFIAALSRLISDATKRKFLRQSGLDYALRNFSYEASFNSLILKIES